MKCNSFWACPFRILAIAYLIGSIPFGWIIGRLFFKHDIRKAGSGNIGATNALRSFGTAIGVLVLLLDFGKGFAAAWLAKQVFVPHDFMIPLTGAMVVIGHIFPLWLDFKGGKGIATAAGVFTVFMPWLLLIALGVFVVTVAISRYVSLGSIIAALGLLISSIVANALYGWDFPMLIFIILLVIIVIIKHISNIKRLLSRQEQRISFSRKGSR